MRESYNNNIKGLKGRECGLTDLSEFPVTGKTTTRNAIRKQTLREGEREREREGGKKERGREREREARKREGEREREGGKKERGREIEESGEKSKNGVTNF